MNLQTLRGSRSRHPVGCLGVWLAVAFATTASFTRAGDEAAPTLSPARTGTPSILDPVPIDGGEPSAVTAPVVRMPVDGRVYVLLGAFAAAGILVRSLPRRGGKELPEGVFAVLGEAPLAGTQTVRVVRFGPKTILVGLTGSTCTTLAEIDDAVVTAAIVDDCRDRVRSSAQSLAIPLRLPASLWAALGHRAGGMS